MLHVDQPGIDLHQLPILAVAPDHAFGFSGGTAGVDQAADVFFGGADWWAERIASGDKIFITDGPVALSIDADKGLH
ncbi:hypothetical protein D3C85_1449170 [compost metagenome]